MADDVLKGFARTLRRKQTDVEKRIWRCLRSREFEGIKFRRQQPIWPYIVDFCSFEKKVIIELDGGQHSEMKEADAKRTECLQESGYKVIRVWNNDVIHNPGAVLEYIRQNLELLPLTPPSPASGEGERKRNGRNKK